VRLLLDAMLGKLATYLRMCGHDAAYALERGVEADGAVAALARAEGRTLLTRDRRLAARVDGALPLRSRDVTDQLRELADAGVDLSLGARPPRCGACNGELRRLTDGEDRGDAPPGATAWRCRDCGQRFWEGSHWEDVRRRLAAL
jgi:uncharacterized protein with PIN domain